MTEARVLRSIPLLNQAALDAVRQWVYTPTLLNGVPVPVVMTVTVAFTLRQADQPAFRAEAGAPDAWRSGFQTAGHCAFGDQGAEDPGLHTGNPGSETPGCTGKPGTPPDVAGSSARRTRDGIVNLTGSGVRIRFGCGRPAFWRLAHPAAVCALIGSYYLGLGAWQLFHLSPAIRAFVVASGHSGFLADIPVLERYLAVASSP